MLPVVEVFATMQGEGSLAGTPAIFVRLAGCNYWSGYDAGRVSGRGGCARWCDTDFIVRERLDVSDLVGRVLDARTHERLVVITGGEPGLHLTKQVGQDLVDALHDAGLTVAVETNGSIDLSGVRGLDHITVSPKPMQATQVLAPVHQASGTDLKVVWPQPIGLDTLRALAVGFEHAFLQPKDEPGQDHLVATMAVAALLGWRVSIQTHKHLGLP